MQRLCAFGPCSNIVSVSVFLCIFVKLLILSYENQEQLSKIMLIAKYHYENKFLSSNYYVKGRSTDI